MLLLLLFEVFEEFFGDVAILGGELVVGIQTQGFLIMLESIFPVGLLGLVLLGGLTFSNKGVGQIIGGIFAKFLVFSEESIGKLGDSFFEVAALVGGRSGVELESLR